MVSQERWRRYRRESILFAAAWLVLGVGTLLVGNLETSAEAGASAWAMATGPVPLVAFAVGVVATVYMCRGSLSGSLGSRLALGACLLGVLIPLYFYVVTYAVVGAREATAGVLVTSATFAWAGVANFGMVMFMDGRGRRS